jgi:hypothetical protein
MTMPACCNVSHFIHLFCLMPDEFTHEEPCDLNLLCDYSPDTPPGMDYNVCEWIIIIGNYATFSMPSNHVKINVNRMDNTRYLQ